MFYFAAIVGFERETYDVGEQDEHATVCVVVLNGTIVENISLQLNTHDGTAMG